MHTRPRDSHSYRLTWGAPHTPSGSSQSSPRGSSHVRLTATQCPLLIPPHHKPGKLRFLELQSFAESGLQPSLPLGSSLSSQPLVVRGWESPTYYNPGRRGGELWRKGGCRVRKAASILALPHQLDPPWAPGVPSPRVKRRTLTVYV